MRTIVVGANGQLGSDCVQEFRRAGHDVIELNHSDVDIRDSKQVMMSVGQATPDLIINTAAFHHLDACEFDPAEAFRVNVNGATNLAVAANACSARLVHISTDYVFDGHSLSPYHELDVARPLSVYGNSKLVGEGAVRAIAKKAYVVRSSALYGLRPCRGKGGLNFVRRMLRLAAEGSEVRVVSDEIVTPTSTVSLARQLVLLVESDAYGIVHATCQGECSWLEFAKEVFDYAGIETPVAAAVAKDFPSKAERPAYSALENRHLTQRGLDIMPTWYAALHEYMDTLQEAEPSQYLGLRNDLASKPVEPTQITD